MVKMSAMGKHEVNVSSLDLVACGLYSLHPLKNTEYNTQT